MKAYGETIKEVGKIKLDKWIKCTYEYNMDVEIDMICLIYNISDRVMVFKDIHNAFEEAKLN